jgi:excisionase family DNA binding protein
MRGSLSSAAGEARVLRYVAESPCRGTKPCVAGRTWRLAKTLIDVLDDRALEDLADRLAPLIAARTIRAALDSDDRWLTATDAATYLGISTNALHKLTADRLIPFEQEGAGCKLYFKRSQLDAWRGAGGSRSGVVGSHALP